MNDRYGTPPMFDQIPEQPVAGLPARLNDTRTGYGPISYRKYRTQKFVPCDDCKAAFLDDPKAPASRKASFKRVQLGTDDLLLCYPHKEERREREAR